MTVFSWWVHVFCFCLVKHKLFFYRMYYIDNLSAKNPTPLDFQRRHIRGLPQLDPFLIPSWNASPPSMNSTTRHLRPSSLTLLLNSSPYHVSKLAIEEPTPLKRPTRFP